MTPPPPLPPLPGCGRPIETTNAADVFDVVLHPEDRADGCLAFLFLDDGGYLLTPFVVADPPEETTLAERTDALQNLFEQCGVRAPKVAFARGRGGSLLLRDDDRAWHELVIHVAAGAEVDLIGSWLATDAGIRAFPTPLAQSAESIPA